MPVLRRLRVSLRWSVALLLPAAAQAARLAVVVDDAKPATRQIIAALEQGLGPENHIQIHTLRAADLSNPVTKGRFLARVASADLVVPIGDPASRLVADELEDLRTFFIAAGGLSGEFLSRPHVAGILSYSPEETVRVAKALLPEMKIISVLYTPGYETVARQMESAAGKADLAAAPYRVKSRQEVGPAVREALARTDFLWMAGDPLLTHDLVFTYILQESLRLKKPVATPLPALVEKGALFCVVLDREKAAPLAADALARLLSAQAPFAGAGRLRPAPGEGLALINRRLTDKWNIRIPPSLRLGEDHAP